MRRWQSLMVVLFVTGLAMASTGNASAESPTPLVHVVLLTLKPDAAEDTTAKMAKDAKEMLGEIPVVANVRLGKMKSSGRKVEGKKFDIGLYVLIKDSEKMKEYIAHPKHIGFATKYGPSIQAMQVYDFESDE